MSWLRPDSVDISKYLPDFLQSEEDFRNVLTVESSEHERQRLIIADLLAQMFIDTADWALARWETVLQLTPRATDTIEERRNRILLKLYGRQTSTVDFMRRLAKRYCTDDTVVSIDEHNSEYAFDVRLEGELLDKPGLKEAIETYKPAHLGCYIKEIIALIEHLQMESDFLGNAIADTIEFYPWIGRYYNGVYSYGGSCQTFDGSWTYDGAHDYDGGSIDETAAPHPLLYDGVSNYDGEYTYTPYGRASPPFIFYNSLEPDMLEAVAAVPELVEQYTACYQYNGGISYDGQTHYGYDKGPQESTDVEHILPQLADAEKVSELQEADVTPNIVEMYPYGRTRYYNGAFTYDRMNTYDGSGWYGNEWKYDGNPDAMPPPFEACRFDGTATYDGTRTYEAPRLAGARYDSDTADDLEDAVKTVDAETVELKEASAITDDLELSDTYAKNVFDGTLSYDGVATYTTNYLEEAHESIKAASSDQLDHGEAFDGTHAFDGSLTYAGKADGPKDEMSVTLYVGRQYNGLTNYDAGCKDVFDGSLTYGGGKTYAGLRSISFTYSNLTKYDGTRRFARPYESYSVYEISA